MNEPITMFKKQFNFLSMAVHPFPNLYAMQSAPWYTELLLDGAMVVVVVVVCIILKLRKEIVLHTNSGRRKYGREPCCSHRHISKKRHEKNYNRDQQNCQCVFTFCRQEQRTANRCNTESKPAAARIICNCPRLMFGRLMIEYRI